MGMCFTAIKNGNYEGYIQTSMMCTCVNFEYWRWDVKTTIKRKNPTSKKIDTTTYDLILVNKLGNIEWFNTLNMNIIVCTKERVNTTLENNI